MSTATGTVHDAGVAAVVQIRVPGTARTNRGVHRESPYPRGRRDRAARGGGVYSLHFAASFADGDVRREKAKCLVVAGKQSEQAKTGMEPLEGKMLLEQRCPYPPAPWGHQAVGASLMACGLLGIVGLLSGQRSTCK